MLQTGYRKYLLIQVDKYKVTEIPAIESLQKITDMCDPNNSAIEEFNMSSGGFSAMRES
jgi:hypothetical protein